MKQEDKDHLLNDRGLSPEQQDDLRDFFDRLDLMGVEYYPLSFHLREIMDEKTFERVYRTSPTAPEFLKVAKQDVKNLLDTHIEFDIYIPSKGWVLNVNPSVFSGEVQASCIPIRNIGESLNVFKNDDPLIDSFNSHAPIYFEKEYRYPCKVNDKDGNIILLLWSKIQAKDYDQANETPRKNDVPILTDWHQFYMAFVSEQRFKELQEKRFQQFLDNNPFWKEQYAKFAADFLLQSNKAQTVSSYPYAFEKAKAFVKAGNPHIDLNDIINSRI